MSENKHFEYSCGTSPGAPLDFDIESGGTVQWYCNGSIIDIGPHFSYQRYTSIKLQSNALYDCLELKFQRRGQYFWRSTKRSRQLGGEETVCYFIGPAGS